MTTLKRLSFLSLLQLCVLATQDVQLAQRAATPDDCAGYNARNVHQTAHSLTADLVLAGACALYGEDIPNLKLTVSYEDSSRLHVKIADAAGKRYQVPESVFPRPKSANLLAVQSELEFKYKTAPFSFQVIRKADKEVLFDTTGHALVFEQQYIRLQTSLPPSANIYGLGEHTNTFRLPSNNFTRTFWNRDAYGVAEGTNLYSTHPIYFEHRTTGTHGVFLLNSNGIDVKINQVNGKTALEYNAIGGIFDFYFLSGSKKDPSEVSRQYAKVAGLPAEVPYWGFGFHQCRYGYQNFVEVADVVANYSKAGIPLETMWTDIDYMKDRWVFTNDPQYFPTNRVQEIIHYLHAHDQHYIVMVDPAVAAQPNKGYGAYDNGVKDGIFLKGSDGNLFHGVVWPGVTVYPDWFNPKTQSYWTNEFKTFFDPKSGWDIDGLWIDMNEAASFCPYPCDPEATAASGGFPPNRTTPPPDPNAPIFTDVKRSAMPLPESVYTDVEIVEREDVSIDARAPAINASLNYLEPPYAIANAAGALSASTVYTDAVHSNGLIEYDVHNLYGTMMSIASQKAMEARRPGLRTLIITRSTFAGAGAKVGKWLGDNLSTWWHYRNSVAGVLGFNAIYQVPMVGPDTCGFGADTTEFLCSRWATLGAFYPFYRNHNQDGQRPQEFYRWPLVTAAAKNALDIRYRLLDYFNTALHAQTVDGSPSWNPLFFKYPADKNTWGIDTQFFFGDSILVSPVVEENSTSVTFYLPKDKFYDFKTFAPIEGKGANVTLNDVAFTDIPVYIRGGTVLPLRAKSAMTTTALRKNDFQIVVAPAADGTASGKLYVDDGVSLKQKATTEVSFKYAKGRLTVTGHFGYKLGVKISSVTVLGVKSSGPYKLDGKAVAKTSVAVNAASQSVDVKIGIPFTKPFTLSVA
ncbi:glycoside hydrolase family 31 protein [Exidia glandulosa HHB12029]|uniref:Probable alpha/beta-glucosidase agdC n=1 Tax=Exidia glandulosa HHB12029 TaxID=1314781 RepID=A0A165PBL1_EXIGL|nr:glycoside hydrolase family 31 protein [Exidia glandulosa HHB12029]